MGKRWFKIVILFSLWGLTSCAPGFGNKISLPPISTPVIGHQVDSRTIQMRPVVDARNLPTLVQIEGRSIVPAQDIGGVVDEAFRTYARAYNWDVRPGTGKLVSVRVQEWFADVRPSFPASTVEARVVLEIEIWSENLILDYRSRYEGSTTYQHPLMNESKVTWALNDALGFALQEFFSDSRVAPHL
jgi:hypothetical protein